MELNNDEYKKVVSTLRKKILKESPKYQQNKMNFLCSLLTSVFLCFMSYFLMGDVISDVANVMLMLSSSICIFSGGVMALGRWAATYVAKDIAKSAEGNFQNFDELLKDLENKEEYDRSDNMEQKIQYTKDGRPFIDVDFVEVPDSEASDIVYEPIPNPGIIDVEWYHASEITLKDNVRFLMEYVEDVGYDGYESDLAVLGAMLDFLASGKVDDLTKASLENTLHTLAEAILNRACKEYGLPLVRK